MLFVIEAIGVLALVFVLWKRGTFDRFKKKPAQERAVSVGRGQIWYLDGARKGPDVLLLHGFPGDKELWFEVAPLIEQAGFHVVVPDLPGFGANVRDPDAKYDATSLAKQIRAFAKKADLGMFHLVGHGAGAVIAASYAYGTTLEVATLTLIEPLGVKVPAESELDKQLAKGRNPLIIGSPASYDSLLALLTAKPLAMPAALKKARAEALAGNRDFYQQVWAELMQGERAHLLDLLLPEIRKRTLVVFGSKSRIVHPMTAKLIEKRMEDRDVRVVTIADSGHWPMLEKPKELAEALVTFFKGEGKPRATPRTGELES